MGQGLSRPRKVQAPEPRFCPNRPRRRGGGTAQGRVSRDAAASTIHAHTQGTLPALVGAFFFAATVHEPPPVPRFSSYMSNSFRGPECGVPQRPIGQATLSSCHGVPISECCTLESANRRPRLTGRYRAIVPALYLVGLIVRGWHNCAVSARQPRAAIGWFPSTPPR